ncbi:hypothetical protein D3C72_2294210 [compost metagenome]
MGIDRDIAALRAGIVDVKSGLLDLLDEVHGLSQPDASGAVHVGIFFMAGQNDEYLLRHVGPLSVIRHRFG